MVKKRCLFPVMVSFTGFTVQQSLVFVFLSIYSQSCHMSTSTNDVLDCLPCTYICLIFKLLYVEDMPVPSLWSKIMLTRLFQKCNLMINYMRCASIDYKALHSRVYYITEVLSINLLETS